MNNPGCNLKTSVDSNDFDPEWDEWLIFENAPMFRWEAALDERIKITVWDSEDGNWFDQTDDKLGELTYNALAAAGDFVVHTQTLDFGSGKTLEGEERSDWASDSEYQGRYIYSFVFTMCLTLYARRSRHQVGAVGP